MSDRKFQVVVWDKAGKPATYPLTDPRKTIRNMEVLHKRGLNVAALTQGHGIAEQLTLDEMRGIYDALVLDDEADVVESVYINVERRDTAGTTHAFTWTTGPNGFYENPLDENLSNGHTESAQIAGVEITGDMWRFIEGTLGDEELYNLLTDDPEVGLEFFKEFIDEFPSFASDEEALVAWDAAAMGSEVKVKVDGHDSSPERENLADLASRVQVLVDALAQYDQDEPMLNARLASSSDSGEAMKIFQAQDHALVKIQEAFWKATRDTNGYSREECYHIPLAYARRTAAEYTASLEGQGVSLRQPRNAEVSRDTPSP